MNHYSVFPTRVGVSTVATADPRFSMCLRRPPFQYFLDLSVYEYSLGTADSVPQRRILPMVLYHRVHGQIDVFLRSGDIGVAHDPLHSEGVAAGRDIVGAQ